MTYRIYYNGPVPPMWSIDEGTQFTEICVQHILVVELIPSFHTTNTDVSVRAWIEIDGKMEIVNGVAIFMKEEIIDGTRTEEPL